MRQRIGSQRTFPVFVILLASVTAGRAADLSLTGVSGKTYQNQAYGHLSLVNCGNITIKNCTFSTSNSTNGSSGGVADISGSNHITIDSCDFNGDTTTCTGLNVAGSYITISRCTIHDIADDGFQIGGGDHIYLHNNTICHLYGCGTDGGCGPCYNGHSDAFELSHLDSVELTGNLVYDVRSTSAVIIDNYSGGVTVSNLLIENNIFYTPETGVIVYVFYVDGIRMYNNTFWKSNWLGVAVGPSTARVEAYNNIFQCIDYTFMGGNPAGHTWDYNLVGFTGRGLAAQTHDVVNADPKFRRIPAANDNTAAHLYRAVTPADFELLAGSPAIGKGMSGGSIPAVDFYGRSRKPPYDLGAIAYQNSAVAHAFQSYPVPGKGFRFTPFPSHASAFGLADRNAVIFDLYGRRMSRPVTGGCYLVRYTKGRIARIAGVP